MTDIAATTQRVAAEAPTKAWWARSDHRPVVGDHEAANGRARPPRDPLLDFHSEDQPSITGDDAERQPAVRRNRITKTRVTLAVLALLALAQGALIAVWLKSGVATLSATGSVTVTSEPAGAPVSIDGVSRGVTPLTLALASGSRRIEVGGGADTLTRVVELARGGDASVHVEIPPAPAAATADATGGLQISTEPPGAMVSVDGTIRGPSPISVQGLTVGAHEVSVKAANGTVQRTVSVQSGAVSSLMVSMAGPSQFASGWLSISSPIPAEVREGGTLLGNTSTPRIMVSAGRHDLELSNEALGYRAQRTVHITPGNTVTVSLEVPRGTLHVNALPWAEVWIDGQRAGETPLGNLSLPLGTHEVLFRHPELGELRRTVVVTVSERPVRVGVDLRKERQ